MGQFTSKRDSNFHSKLTGLIFKLTHHPASQLGSLGAQAANTNANMNLSGAASSSANLRWSW